MPPPLEASQTFSFHKPDDAFQAVGGFVEEARDRQAALGAAVRQHRGRRHEPEAADIVIEPLRVRRVVAVVAGDAGEQILIVLAGQQIAVVERGAAEIGQQAIAAAIHPHLMPALHLHCVEHGDLSCRGRVHVAAVHVADPASPAGAVNHRTQHDGGCVSPPTQHGVSGAVLRVFRSNSSRTNRDHAGARRGPGQPGVNAAMRTSETGPRPTPIRVRQQTPSPPLGLRASFPVMVSKPSPPSRAERVG